MYNVPLYITWKESNNTGVSIIDEQHRGIVSTINTLYFYIQQNEWEKIIESVFINLEQYSKIHFETEEKLLNAIEYPEYEEHMKIHKYYTEQLFSVKAEYIVNKDKDAVMKFLKTWWMTHICNEDKKYGEWIISNNKKV